MARKMIPLIVIGPILLLLSFLLLMPVYMELDFNEEFGVRFKYLFLAYTLFPEAGEEKEEEKPAEIEEAKEKERFTDKLKSFFKREGLSGFFSFIKDVFSLFTGTLKNIIKHLRISKFDLYFCAGGEDSAEAALNYGKANAVIAPFYSFLFSAVKCRKHRAVIDLDYSREESLIRFDAKISVKLFFLIIEGIRLIKNGIPLIRRFNGPKEIAETQNNANKKVNRGSEKG